MADQLKIAIKLPNWLGDIVMSMPFIYSCQRIYRSSRIDLILLSKFHSLPFLRDFRLIEYQDNPIKLGLKLREMKYDQFWLLPNSLSAGLMSFLSRATNRIGYRSELRSFLLTSALIRLEKPRQQHYSKELLDLLELYSGKKAEVRQVRLDYDKGLISKVADYGLAEKYVLVAPFSAYGPARNWSLASFTKLFKRLTEDGYQVVVVGLKQDSQAASQLDGDLVKNLVGKTDMQDLLSIMLGSSLLITMDSGLAHLGALYGLKQLVIFGSTNPVWTRPLSENYSLIYRAESCSPCYDRRCRFGHYNCLEKISSDEVYQECIKLLARKS